MDTRPFNLRTGLLSILVSIANVLSPSSGSATENGVEGPAVAELERRIVELKAERADRYEALQDETEARLIELEAQITSLKARDEAAPSSPARLSSLAVRPALHDPELAVGGDFRLRYEHTTGHAGAPARDRGVLRGRLGASYSINQSFTIGGRLTTGDPDDPNSADATMDEFVDDLTLSLDQAYARYQSHGLAMVAGKFANPFVHTELAWDGDVNPYGLAGHYTLYKDADTAVRVTGIYSIVDEQIDAQGSDMLGAQVSLDSAPATDWRFGFAAAYYDYQIGSLLAADSGDTRDNNLSSVGDAYLSDYDLLDFVVQIDYSALPGARPLRVVGNYVRNLGAAVPEDSGWSVDFSLGELGDTGDWRFGYGYAVAQTDAVLAALSQDNTTYATNYREHTISVDYIAFADIYLNLTAYLYRRDDSTLVDLPGDNDWISRFRLNLQFQF